MTRMKWGLFAVVGLAAAAFVSTPPPAKAECGGHQAMKTTAGTTDTYAQQYIPMSAPKFSIGYVQGDTASAIGHSAINGTMAKDDPAAKVDKSALSDNDIIGHGIVNTSANNTNVDIGAGGSEEAANASEGAGFGQKTSIVGA